MKELSDLLTLSTFILVTVQQEWPRGFLAMQVAKRLVNISQDFKILGLQKPQCSKRVENQSRNEEDVEEHRRDYLTLDTGTYGTQVQEPMS